MAGLVQFLFFIAICKLFLLELKNMTVYFNPSEFLKYITEKFYRALSQIQQMLIHRTHRHERRLGRSCGDAGGTELCAHP